MAEPFQQRIGFCATADGARIAYATVGSGPPLVKIGHWLSHLEFDTRSPVWRPWIRELSRYHTLVRYDERGCGLSEWTLRECSLETSVRTLEAVVDTLELERFPLLSLSKGGPVAITYAARHPERVSHLIFYGSHARGQSHRAKSEEEREEQEVLLGLIRVGWGKDHAAFRQVFTSLFLPEGTPEQVQWFNELQRVSAPPENAARICAAFYEADVRALAPGLDVPTLVVHSTGDLVIPHEEGRLLASMIHGARFVPLESRNHILLESEPAWPRFLREVRTFLGVPADASSHPDPGRHRVESVLTPGPPAERHRATFADYEVLEKLGGGGMGVVYKGRDPRLHRLVALKFLPAWVGGDTELRVRFLQEAKTIASLDHPNICTIFEVAGQESGQLVIVMPFYDGETLREKIARGPLPVGEALEYALQVTRGLAHAHAAGVVHRDIKPANVVVMPGERVKILDFGIAKVADANAGLTRTGALLGTLSYMSPEQASGDPVDHRADLWSLGVVLYEMLAGRPPFAAESLKALHYAIQWREPERLLALRPDVPLGLEAVVQCLLEKEPARRYQSAEALAAALESLRGNAARP